MAAVMTATPSDSIADLTRDIAAARADLQGRRDQLTADYDERLAALTALHEQLEAGALERRAVELRVRQIVHERTGVATATRAGRTTIGMNVAPPTRATTASAMPTTRPQLSLALAEAALQRALHAVDLRLSALAVRRVPKAELAEVKLEVWVLLHLRRGLELPPGASSDPVLLGYLCDGAERAVTAVADLEAGGAGRIQRLVELTRAAAAPLVAVGGSPEGVKDHLLRAKAQATSGSPSEQQAAVAELCLAMPRLAQELERRFAAETQSLLEEALRA